METNRNNKKKKNNKKETTNSICKLTIFINSYKKVKKIFKYKIKKKKENTRICIDICDRKIIRYKTRLKLSFDDYKKFQPNEKIARKLLIKRLCYLTGNTKLSNNKDNTLIGIYFSNSLITDFFSLKDFECLLRA